MSCSQYQESSLSFSQTIADYILFHLNRNFKSLRINNLDSYLMLIDGIKDVFKQDTFAKYPNFEQSRFDLEFQDLVEFDPALEAVLYYRFARQIFLKESSDLLLKYLSTLMRVRSGMELYYSTDIGPGLNVQHGSGIIVGPRNRIGKNFIIHQGVTLGQGGVNTPLDVLDIGDNVIVFAGAKIVGNLKIGNNVNIGANAVVTKNLDSDSTYVGVPARKI